MKGLEWKAYALDLEGRIQSLEKELRDRTIKYSGAKMISGTFKVCKTCTIKKPLAEFYEAKENRDGYNSRCKLCIRGKL